MRRLLLAAAIISIVSTTARADEDYSDKTSWTCDNDSIQSELSNLWENGPAGKLGINLIYVKNITETLRNNNELRCHITAVTNQGPVSGIFKYFSQDGHALVAFEPNKRT